MLFLYDYFCILWNIHLTHARSCSCRHSLSWVVFYAVVRSWACICPHQERFLSWASFQMREIAGWACTGNAGKSFRETVPSIPGACATRNLTYLVRGPSRETHIHTRVMGLDLDQICCFSFFLYENVINLWCRLALSGKVYQNLQHPWGYTCFFVDGYELYHGDYHYCLSEWCKFTDDSHQLYQLYVTLPFVRETLQECTSKWYLKRSHC